jgi:hypothetical protein
MQYKQSYITLSSQTATLFGTAIIITTTTTTTL